MTPIQQLRAGRMPYRLTQLIYGLILYGVSMGLMFRSGLGLDPWDVFHAGVAEHVPLTFGQVVIVTSFVVLLLWVPLKQWPGLGTVVNAVLIGVATDATLAVVSSPDSLTGRGLMLVTGILLNAVATAAYIGAQLGPGPRDGLMTGLVRRTGWSVRLVRTSLEASVLVVGFLLGGVVGLGTVLYALSIGPLVQVLMPLFETRLDRPEKDPYFDYLQYRWARPAW
jgi:uncharacterized membrane protein YczE